MVKPPPVVKSPSLFSPVFPLLVISYHARCLVRINFETPFLTLGHQSLLATDEGLEKSLAFLGFFFLGFLFSGFLFS